MKGTARVRRRLSFAARGRSVAVQHRQLFRTLAAAKKTEPRESIRHIKVGNTDSHGNIVSHVHASGNDYVIYEIQHADIGHRLRVLIDGRNDVEEQFLKEKFARVKKQYTEAKGFLYRSPNFGMMKNRIAHTLASHFTLPGKDGAESEFSALLDEIKDEHNKSVANRGAYLAPSMLVVILLFSLAITHLDLRTANNTLWQALAAALAAALGGSMSILLKMKDVNFEEYRRWQYYSVAGVERLFLAFVAGAIAFVLLKAKLFLPALLESSYWGLMAIVAAAGFSEALVPRYISNVDRAN